MLKMYNKRARNNILGHPNNRPCSHTWIWRDYVETREEFQVLTIIYLPQNTSQQECMSCTHAQYFWKQLGLGKNCYSIIDSYGIF